mmetsp:Transcript_35171/g.83323  ORF Transcript_35171/g.83323 Transcript_35171/m.83323 type:complete len:203 (+) Transcript_35171:584-1192(+)
MRKPPKMFPARFRSCGCMRWTDWKVVVSIATGLYFGFAAVPIMTLCSKRASSSVGCIVLRLFALSSLRRELPSVPSSNPFFSSAVKGFRGLMAAPLPWSLTATNTTSAVSFGSGSSFSRSRTSISRAERPVHDALPSRTRSCSIPSVSGYVRSSRSRHAVTSLCALVVGFPSSQCINAMFPANASISSNSFPKRSPPRKLRY